MRKGMPRVLQTSASLSRPLSRGEEKSSTGAGLPADLTAFVSDRMVAQLCWYHDAVPRVLCRGARYDCCLGTVGSDRKPVRCLTDVTLPLFLYDC